MNKKKRKRGKEEKEKTRRHRLHRQPDMTFQPEVTWPAFCLSPIRMYYNRLRLRRRLPCYCYSYCCYLVVAQREDFALSK